MVVVKNEEVMLEFGRDSLTLNFGRLQGGNFQRPNELRYSGEMKLFLWLQENHN